VTEARGRRRRIYRIFERISVAEIFDDAASDFG
jgi:hypothetical protein